MKYDPAEDHEPLFDVSPTQVATREGGPSKSIRSVTRGMCPQCAADRPTGIIRQGAHLVWRLHTRTLGSGARIECPGAGAAICHCPPRPVVGVTTPACACETRKARP